MAIIPKSVQTIVNDPKIASAIQRRLQSQVSAIERKVQSAESSLKTSKDPRFDSGREIQRFKSQFQSVIRSLNELSDIPDKIARSVDRLSKSFVEIRRAEQQLKQERYWGPKRAFSGAAGRLENDIISGNRMGVKSGYDALKVSAESSKSSLKELTAIGGFDRELVSLMKQLVASQQKAVSSAGSRLAAAETTALAGGRGVTGVIGGATGPLPPSFYNRYGVAGIPPGRATGALYGGRGATERLLGGGITGPIAPSYYARMGVAPTPSRVTTPFPSRGATVYDPSSHVSVGTRALVPGGAKAGMLPYPSTAPTVPLGGVEGAAAGAAMAGEHIPGWVKGVGIYEAARFAYRFADRTIDKGDEAYVNTFDVSRRLGTDVNYGYARGRSMDEVSGMGMRDLTNLMGGRASSPVGSVNSLLLSEGYDTAGALEVMSGYGRFGGLRSASKMGAAYSRDRTAGFMSGSEWTSYAGRLADLGFASDISPAGLDSRSLMRNMAVTREFVGSLGAATGNRNFGKDTAMTMFNSAMDIGSRGNFGDLRNMSSFVSGLATNTGLPSLRTPEGIASALGAAQGSEPSMFQRPVLNNMMLQMYKRITGSGKGTIANWNKFMVGMGGSKGDLSKYAPIMKDWEKENMPLEMQLLSLGNMKAFPAATMYKGVSGEFRRRGGLLKSMAPLIMGSSAMFGDESSAADYSATYFPKGGLLDIPESKMDEKEKAAMARMERHAIKSTAETVGAAGFSEDALPYLKSMVDLEAKALDEFRKLNDKMSLPTTGTVAPGTLGVKSIKELDEWMRLHGAAPPSP